MGVLGWPIALLSARKSFSMSETGGSSPTWHVLFDHMKVKVCPKTALSPLRLAASCPHIPLTMIGGQIATGSAELVCDLQSKHGFTNITEKAMSTLHATLKLPLPDVVDLAAPDHKAAMALGLLHHQLRDAPSTLVKQIMAHRAEVGDEKGCKELSDPHDDVPIDEDAIQDVREQSDRQSSTSYMEKAEKSRVTKATQTKYAIAFVEKAFSKDQERPACVQADQGPFETGSDRPWTFAESGFSMRVTIWVR